MPSRRNDDIEKEFTKDLLSLIKSSISSTQHMNEAIIRLQEQQGSLEDDVSSLLKVVRDGNGRPALLSRLDNLERQVKQDNQGRQMRWDLLLVAVPGVLALLSQAMGMG